MVFRVCAVYGNASNICNLCASFDTSSHYEFFTQVYSVRYPVLRILMKMECFALHNQPAKKMDCMRILHNIFGLE